MGKVMTTRVLTSAVARAAASAVTRVDASVVTRVRVGVSRGASLPVEIIKDVKAKPGVTILEGYGLSETSPVDASALTRVDASVVTRVVASAVTRVVAGAVTRVVASAVTRVVASAVAVLVAVAVVFELVFAVAIAGVFAAVVATTGCAPTTPEKLERPKHEPVEHEVVGELMRPQLVDRPVLQLVNPAPDFHDELRWPLTAMSHPALEPKFDIASQFAEVGVGWMELCARGVQNTTGRDKDMLAYLRGWCAAIKDDADTACANLTPLLHSTRSGLATAVRSDLANILANGHADKASHLIKANNIRDVTVLDLLAANYVEVGTAAEASAFNRDAMSSDDHATAATTCTRLTKAIVLSDDKTSALLLDIKDLATTPKLPDPTCVRLHHKLTCWRNQADCRAYLADEGLDAPLVALSDAYYSWPNGRSQRHWLDILDKALGAAALLPGGAPRLPGANAVVFAALENAVCAEPCSDATRSWLSVRTSAFREFLDGPARGKLDALIASCR